MEQIIRSEEEITEQIEKLKSLRHRIPAWSGFGDNNLALIDAEVKTLERRRCFYDDLMEINPDAARASEDAWLWLLGENEESEYPNPSSGWEPLAAPLASPEGE